MLAALRKEVDFEAGSDACNGRMVWVCLCASEGEGSIKGGDNSCYFELLPEADSAQTTMAAK